MPNPLVASTAFKNKMERTDWGKKCFIFLGQGEVCRPIMFSFLSCTFLFYFNFFLGFWDFSWFWKCRNASEIAQTAHTVWCLLLCFCCRRRSPTGVRMLGSTDGCTARETSPSVDVAGYSHAYNVTLDCSNNCHPPTHHVPPTNTLKPLPQCLRCKEKEKKKNKTRFTTHPDAWALIGRHLSHTITSKHSGRVRLVFLQ